MPSALATLIREEIERDGPLRFSRFMERCLFHPRWGYYENDRARDRVGRAGDYYTSVSVGGLFGTLLAFDVSRRMDKLDVETPMIVEAGAHDGRLAEDILSWMQRARPRLFARLRYAILEPSARRGRWQAERRGRFAGKIEWMESWDRVPGGSFTGVLVCNELLDAMPVDVARWDGRRRAWREALVGRDGERFLWRPAEKPLEGPDAPALPDALAAVLPDGFQIELRRAARVWWRQAADRLRSGWMAAFDYGATGETLLSPRHARGTLRGYRGHAWVDDPLADPGEQDITAHVDWSEVIRAGETSGLVTERMESQGRFLSRIAADMMGAGEPMADSALGQMRSLTHPDHMGETFQTLIQARRAGAPKGP